MWFAIGGVLLQIAGSLVGRVLLALGMGFVTYTGFSLGIDYLLTSIKASFAGMPSEAVSFLAWLWVDKAIGLMFSTYSAALVVKLAGNASFTKISSNPFRGVS